MSDEKISIHIDSTEQRADIPNAAGRCDRKDCPGPEGWETGFGMAGGGFGPYEYCAVCERIVSKSQVED